MAGDGFIYVRFPVPCPLCMRPQPTFAYSPTWHGLSNTRPVLLLVRVPPLLQFRRRSRKPEGWLKLGRPRDLLHISPADRLIVVSRGPLPQGHIILLPFKTLPLRIYQCSRTLLDTSYLSSLYNVPSQHTHLCLSFVHLYPRALCSLSQISSTHHRSLHSKEEATWRRCIGLQLPDPRNRLQNAPA